MSGLKVLVGVDKSPESHIALRYVCHLLEHFDAEVEAIYAKPDVDMIRLQQFDVPFLKPKDPGETIERETEEVRGQIMDACQVCLAGKVPCEPKIVVGEPAEVILEEARSGDYDMIVLGSHGHSALKGLILGTVHSKILHHAKRPVLIVRDLREVQRVLVVYRGTKCDQEALEFLAPLLERKKPHITVLHVRETDKGESEEFAHACTMLGKETLEKLGHSPEVREAAGDFVDETLKEIISGNYDLVVLGAYGHDRPRIAKMISDEALSIVSRTTRPVLVYRNKNDN